MKALLLAPFSARSLTLVPLSLLLNRTETLATQANRRVKLSIAKLKGILSGWVRKETEFGPIPLSYKATFLVCRALCHNTAFIFVTYDPQITHGKQIGNGKQTFWENNRYTE